MSSATWELERCPKCLGLVSVDLSGGSRLCLSPDCRHEWDPATTTGPLDDGDALEVPELTPCLVCGKPRVPAGDRCEHCGTTSYHYVDDEFEADTARMIASVHAPDDPTHFLPDDTLEQMVVMARERLVGADVLVHELEATGTVIGIDDDGIATVEFGSGFTVEVEPDEFSAVETVDVPDAAVVAIAGTSVTLAAQVIRAGAAAMDVDEPEWKLGLTPENWLPMDADAIPVIEHGASYAIAMVALYAKVPPEQLLDLAQQIDDAAQAAKEASGQ